MNDEFDPPSFVDGSGVWHSGTRKAYQARQRHEIEGGKFQAELDRASRAAEAERRKLAESDPDVSAAPAADPRVERVRMEADRIKAKWEGRSLSQGQGKGVEP